MASDEGFREFQLGGKHLVALFMFSAIVAVVIFLCGVMVGRGVRANATAGTTDAAAAPSPAGDLTAALDVQAGARSTQPPVATVPPPPAVEEAAGEAKTDSGKAEKGVVAKMASPTAAAPAPAPATPATRPAANVPPAPPSGAAGVPGEPAGEGFVVQVAAFPDKAKAEAEARQLLEKSYAAYVVPPASGGGMFRVRIGKFKQRRDAEAVVRRLKKEEGRTDVWIPPVR